MSGCRHESSLVGTSTTKVLVWRLECREMDAMTVV
jgi:hypothetical protein